MESRKTKLAEVIEFLKDKRDGITSNTFADRRAKGAYVDAICFCQSLLAGEREDMERCINTNTRGLIQGGGSLNQRTK